MRALSSLGGHGLHGRRAEAPFQVCECVTACDPEGIEKPFALRDRGETLAHGTGFFGKGRIALRVVARSDFLLAVRSRILPRVAGGLGFVRSIGSCSNIASCSEIARLIVASSARLTSG
jgi:hypothetical protein